jgi:hypothetical protein
MSWWRLYRKHSYSQQLQGTVTAFTENNYESHIQPEHHLICRPENTTALPSKLARQCCEHLLLFEAFLFIFQVETALLTHWWYLSKFKDYPATRKAIIPYVL